ncbi:MAG: siderophore-interacting protein [Bauldia sp.]|nr:siderophore-interacting protein [Bauldia sp.]MCW5777727.1 siderophore-interacting protein [Phycisphaeraceae bacterium]
MAFYRGKVLRIVALTPRMRRVTVGGEALRGYIHTGHFDEHCQVWFPRPGETRVEIPAEAGGSRQPPLARIFTVRRCDPAAGEVDIDFFLHEGGIASPWVRNARPGDPFVLTDSHGHDVVPDDADWRFFVGDSTALPAIGLMLERLRPGVRATVIGIVPDESEQQALASPGDVDLHWVVASTPAEIVTATLHAFEAFERPAGAGYFWVGGEATAARSIRRALRSAGVPSNRFSATGYWRANSEEWDRRYDAIGDTLDERVAAARKAAKDRDSFLDELDRIYADAGL